MTLSLQTPTLINIMAGSPPYSGFVRNRKSFLEGILLHLSVVLVFSLRMRLTVHSQRPFRLHRKLALCIQCSQEAGRKPDGYTPAELGNEGHVRKIACQGVEMGRFDCRIHW